MKIKVAIIGFGHIGKLHAATLLAHSQFELAAIIEPCSDRRNTDFPIPFFSSLDELLNTEIEVDIICIATPNGLHVQQALQCLDAGKHIIVEKPLALNIVDAAAIISLAKQEGLHVFPVMQNRYSPISQWIKQLVDSQKLGKIYLVQTNCFWNRDEKYYQKGSWHGTKDLDGGTLFTQFVHFIDMLYWTFGDIENVNAKFFDFNHQQLTDFEDSGIVQFDFVNGGTGLFSYSTAAFQQNIESSLLIIAENGTVKISGQYMEKVEICRVKEDDFFVKQIEDGSLKIASNAANQYLFYENIVKFLNGESAQLIVAKEAAAVIGIIQRVYALR
ncbi:MAG TPA: Gfo/Idh/MocA family oxidoreductase [Arachidicoccus sp.]